jgi:protein O-mannosyl-transferase
MANRRKKEGAVKQRVSRKTDGARQNLTLLAGWLPFIFIIAFIFLLYGQTLYFSFTYLDDNVLIVDDYPFISNLSNIKLAFQRDVFNTNSPSYRPLLTLSFMSDAQLGQTSPFIYHFSNVLIHALSTCSLFLFFKKFKYSSKLSIIFSTIFAAHPIISQAVAWIPGRNDSLMTLFILLSMISLINFVEKKKTHYYFFHILLFLFALFTKETAIIFPILCLIYLQLIHKERLITLNKGLLFIGWGIVLVTWLLLRRTALANAAKVNVGIEPFFYNMRAFIELLGGIFLPFNLSVYSTFNLYSTVIGFVTLGLLLIAFLYIRNKRINHILFGAFWFAFLLFPTFAVRQDSVDFDYLNHRVYLPLIGILIVLLELLLSAKIDFEGRKSLYVAVSVITVLSIITLLHSSNFNNGISFWTDAVSSSPRSADARYNLGYVNFLNGNYEVSEKNYKEAIELNPNSPILSPKYYLNLGIIYENESRLDEAGQYYKKALNLEPRFALAYCNLGTIYYKQGNLKEAEDNYQKAISIEPKFPLALYNICSIYFQQQKLVEAEDYCKRAVTFDRDFTKAYFALISIYVSKENFEEAIKLVEELEARGVDVESNMPEVIKTLEPFRN